MSIACCNGALRALGTGKSPVHLFGEGPYGDRVARGEQDGVDHHYGRRRRMPSESPSKQALAGAEASAMRSNSGCGVAELRPSTAR